MNSENPTISTESINDKLCQEAECIYDIYIKWTSKSEDVPFKSSEKCVGNGEHKYAAERGITTKLGGQNNTTDVIDPDLGHVSIKDMTNDNCTLGVDGCTELRKIIRTIVNLLVCWVLKYKSKCEFANKIYDDMNKMYGSSKNTILDGIDRCELSESNLSKLNELLNELKKKYLEQEYDSFKSEYIDDIMNSLNDSSLQELLNNCVRKEATIKTLIIVDENKGYLIVKDINKISCPRITRGAPRINYQKPKLRKSQPKPLIV